jgi:hypothetical protein
VSPPVAQGEMGKEEKGRIKSRRKIQCVGSMRGRRVRDLDEDEVAPQQGRVR